MELTILNDTVPLLEGLQIPFTVIRGNAAITNMVDVEIEPEAAVVKLEAMQAKVIYLTKVLTPKRA